jgi:hypothetical protein
MAVNLVKLELQEVTLNIMESSAEFANFFKTGLTWEGIEESSKERNKYITGKNTGIFAASINQYIFLMSFYNISKYILL